MHLITMAHPGEAQGVIEKFNLQRISAQLYQAPEMNLLLTGEGPLEAAIATAAILGQKKFHTVINLGIAGSLNPDLAVGSIYPVRTTYLVIEGKPQFKSIPGHETGIDCLTSMERILDPARAYPLKGLGGMIDREAWGVGMAAKMLGVSFRSYKLISDMAGTIGACELVREEAPLHARKLAQFLTTLLEIKNEPPAEYEFDGFHFTFTQRHHFKHLLSQMAIKSEIPPAAVIKLLPLTRLQQQKLPPKERSRVLLQYMEQELDPLKKALLQQIDLWKSPLARHRIDVQSDPQLEDDRVKLSFQVKDDQELKQKLAALATFSLLPFQQMMEGKLHVE